MKERGLKKEHLGDLAEFIQSTEFAHPGYFLPSVHTTEINNSTEKIGTFAM